MSNANRFRFRAWDTGLGYMIRFTGGYDLDDDFNHMVFHPDKDTPIAGDHGQPGRFILMQSTGLTDKNGTEIFEGDVLRIADRVNAWVIWNKENASFATRGVIGGDDSEHLYGTSLCAEVIGNVHENPELLDRAEKETEAK